MILSKFKYNRVINSFYGSKNAIYTFELAAEKLLERYNFDIFALRRIQTV